jgi:hypothetical protein
MTSELFSDSIVHLICSDLLFIDLVKMLIELAEALVTDHTLIPILILVLLIILFIVSGCSINFITLRDTAPCIAIFNVVFRGFHKGQ